MIYLLGCSLAPLWGWLYTASCRQTRPTKRLRHGRDWSAPHPLRQRHRGTRVRPRGRHEIRPVYLTPVEATP